MKGKIKQGLVGLLVGIAGLVNSGDGYSIKIQNLTSNLSVGQCEMRIKNIAGSNEYNDTNDKSFIPGTAPALEVYSIPYITKLRTDCKPIESTNYTNVYLAVNGTIDSADNQVTFKVEDSTGLEHRNIIAYDTSADLSDPNNIHTIPKDGSVYTITLPDLVNQPVGVYKIIRVIPERILAGDLNEDGKVDVEDLTKYVSEYLVSSDPNGIPAGTGNYLVSDTNHDRITELSDLVSICNTWQMEEE